MKEETIKSILTLCTKFRLRLNNDSVIRFNKNNDDMMVLCEKGIDLVINKGLDEDHHAKVRYTEVKIIEVFE